MTKSQTDIPPIETMIEKEFCVSLNLDYLSDYLKSNRKSRILDSVAKALFEYLTLTYFHTDNNDIVSKFKFNDIRKEISLYVKNGMYDLLPYYIVVVNNKYRYKKYLNIIYTNRTLTTWRDKIPLYEIGKPDEYYIPIVYKQNYKAETINELKNDLKKSLEKILGVLKYRGNIIKFIDSKIELTVEQATNYISYELAATSYLEYLYRFKVDNIEDNFYVSIAIIKLKDKMRIYYMLLYDIYNFIKTGDIYVLEKFKNKLQLSNNDFIEQTTCITVKPVDINNSIKTITTTPYRTYYDIVNKKFYLLDDNDLIFFITI